MVALLRIVFVALASGCALGCTGVIGNADSGPGGAGGGGPAGANAGSSAGAAGGTSSGMGGSSSSSGGGAGAGGSGAAGGATPASVCDRWLADRADLSEGSWSGAVSGCDPGDTAPPGRANALKLVNLYRFIAGLPPVDHDGTRDDKAQQCALMMHANGQLSHSPPPSWTCYLSDGAQAAGNSNIATTPGVAAVDLYMADPGNPATMGHRRWVLSNGLGPIGLGSTSSYSCMWVLGGTASGGNTWTAWPSAGVFPVEAVNASFQSIDQTGWTLQSDTVKLSGAKVTITDAGNDRPVTVSGLSGGYGSSYAIRMLPQGWTTTAGHTYQVEVTSISQPISYSVQVVVCQ